MLALGAYFGVPEKYFGCTEGGGAGLVTTKIKLRQNRKKYFSHFGVLMLQTRPGGWGGSSEVLPPK